ncbi:MAG: permease [Pelagibacterales bacterium MED-G40]|nr:MAG: permease [Pelagibacterales bacterium MED-G40]|tara:strand:+ start:121 stop:1251 length:1131 start_codon:yes stop_codon:yes gene_type:complete
MDIYLPIAQVNVDIFLLLFLSLSVGILSGLFGVGGGFLMTPFLIFMGIPPVYAVPNEVNNILATSVSGSLTHWYKNTLDYKMGLLIVSGGVVGTLIGITTFTYFSEIGKISLIISLLYMYLLAIVGTLMIIEGVKEVDQARKKIIIKKKLHDHNWLQGLPFRMRFPKSKLYESAMTPILLGLVVGFVAAMMGIGGAFLMVPAMIYIVGMPVKLIPGTSLFVTVFISAIVTILHAFNYGSIDLTLVIPLILGSILGVQIGQKLGQYLDSSHLKTLFALLLCAVAIAIAYDSFFKEKENDFIGKEVLNTDLNFFAEFTLKFSTESPMLYGAFAILLAIFLGAFAALMRKFLSPVIKKLLSDFRNKNKTKKEEIKFPEK